MLPHYQYKHYYDEMCGECEDKMVEQDEVYEEGGHCGECDKVMCEDCREDSNCDVCQQKIEDDDGDCAKDATAVCRSCLKKCRSCPGLKFHRSCRAEHKRSCNRLSRARRELAEVEEDIVYKERRIANLQGELRVARRKLAVAHANVRRALQRP